MLWFLYMKEKIFCFARYEMFLWGICKRSILSSRLKSQGGRWRQSRSSDSGENGGSIVLYPEAIAGKLWPGYSITRQTKLSSSLCCLLCLYLFFSNELRCSTFGVGVLPPASGHMSTFWLNDVSASHAKSSVSRKSCWRLPPRNTKELCQSHAKDRHVITLSGSYGNLAWAQFSL